MNSKMTFAATSLLLAGVLAVSYGCASSSDSESGGSGGSSNSSSGGGAGSGGGGGGSSSSSPTAGADSVTFKGGQAQGDLFTGYGWVAMGPDDSLTSPTCDTGKEITGKTDGACKTTTVWKDEGTPHLCMSGTIPTLPAGTPSQADYDNNWGVQIGVNAAEPNDAIGSKFAGYKTMTMTLSGTPTSGLRAMVHLKGDDNGKTYCFDGLKSGVAMKLLNFNTHCWPGGESDTVKLAEADLVNIDKLGLQVSSVQGGEIKVQDLCLEQVDFGK